MTDGELADELQAISGELEQLLGDEQDAADKLQRRFDEDREAIERLLQSVQEARAAGQWRNTRFNVFDVLGRPRLEQAHSNFLAWLLNPGEAHGLGDKFLRQFMAKAIGTEPPSTDVRVTPEFHCGLRWCDIHVKGDGWCLVVENKIDDFPWPDQCCDYQEYCQMVECRGERAWLVYVTPARRPSDLSISWISYSEVRQILELLTPDPSAAPLIENFCEHVISDLEI
jgi:hypothetical protein